MGLTEREKIFQQVVISQSLLKPDMNARGNALRHRQHFGKRKLRNHRRVGLRNCFGVSAGSKTFAVTFAEDFGHLCGREMRCLMPTAKRRKQEYLARFLFVPFG